MASLRTALTTLSLAAGLALAAPALAQNEKPAKPAATPSKQPEAAGNKHHAMADLEKAAQVGPEHIEMNTHMVGDWETKTTYWMDAKSEPKVSEGHAKFDSTVGARFVTQTYTGKMAMPDATGAIKEREFKGHGVYGFNTVTKEYESTWYDTFATGITLSTGKKDAKGDIVFTGQFDDPSTGQRKTSKTVIHFDGREKMSFTMFERGTDGTEVKTLQVDYTRVTPNHGPEGKPAPKKTDK